MDSAFWSAGGFDNPGDPGESKNLFVQFRTGARKNTVRTQLEGRPIFDDVPFITIAIPGDKTLVIDNEAWIDESETPIPAAHNIRFPRQWMAYKAGANQDAVSGTPLSQWPGSTPSFIEEMAAQKVRTVEQLANMSDANCQKFMGGISIRQKAKDFVARAADSAVVDRMRAELTERDERLAALEKLVKEMDASKKEAPKEVRAAR